MSLNGLIYIIALVMFLLIYCQKSISKRPAWIYTPIMIALMDFVQAYYTNSLQAKGNYEYHEWF